MDAGRSSPDVIAFVYVEVAGPPYAARNAVQHGGAELRLISALGAAAHTDPELAELNREFARRRRGALAETARLRARSVRAW